MCFCVFLSLSLHLLSESLQICAVLSCFLSLDGLLIYFPSALFHSLLPLSLPPSICIVSAHDSTLCWWCVLTEKWRLLNSLGEILVSLKLVAKFLLTSAWPGFHPLALKCSVLVRASTSVSSALLQAVWLNQKLEQKEWCQRATGLGRSFLAVRCCISFASEGFLRQIYLRAWVTLALTLSKFCVPFYIFSLLFIWCLIALIQIT